MKALALTVWDKKIFKVFSFGCHGNQSSSQISNLWSFMKVHHPKIISVKFHWNLLASFRGEDFLSNCSQTDRQTHRRPNDGHCLITIAHPEHIVLRWAKISVVNPFPLNDTFSQVWERSLLKTLWEKEKLLVQAISLFPTMFSTPSKTEIIIFFFLKTFSLSSANAFNFGLVQNFVVWEWVKQLLNLSFANAFNLVRAQNLLFGKRLNRLIHTGTHFRNHKYFINTTILTKFHDYCPNNHVASKACRRVSFSFLF